VGQIGSTGPSVAARITVKVTPRAARDEVLGWSDGALKARLRAVPEQGRANVALEALLARELGVAKSLVAVVAGHRGRHKVVEFATLDAVELERRLAAAGCSKS